VLRIDKRAGFATEGAWFWKRHRFCSGRTVAQRAVSPRVLTELAARQEDEPVALLQQDRRCWWWFHDGFYWEDDGLSAEDVMALVVERELRARRKLERAHAVLRRERAAEPRREPIPRELRLAVWERDRGTCVECGGDFELQFDHVIPFSMGGATTAENLQLLCATCNREKGAAL
jgi:5-methylcytosine-specific restriction endonuclease McrA